MLIKKLLEKVSNLSKLSLINQTYKYELAYLNKKFTTQHFSLFIVDSSKPSIQSLHSMILVNKAQQHYF